MALKKLVPLAAGAALLIWLVAFYDSGAVFAAIAGLGWGLVAVVLMHVPTLLADAGAWHRLIPRASRFGYARLAFGRWIGEAVNVAMPLGGDVVRARLAMLHGVPPEQAAASLIADITLAVVTQAAFAVFGAVIVIAAIGGESGVALPLALACLLFAAAVAAFFGLQHAGALRGLAGLVARLVTGEGLRRMVHGAHLLDAEIRATYGRRRDLAAAALWQALSSVLAGAEIWLALHLLGHPVTLLEAIAIDALAQILRSAIFFVPAGLGVQEGGIVLVGTALGIPAETALALALVKRVREWGLGLPGVVAWQALEAARLRRARSEARDVPAQK
jgi:putative membrane protein